MAGRFRAATLSAPLASLALALCILTLLAALAPGVADSAKRSSSPAPSEASASTQEAEAAASEAAESRADRRREKRVSSAGNQASEAPVPAADGESPSADTRAERKAERKAEHKAEREAAKQAKSTAGGGAAVDPATGKAPEKRQRERERAEREQRRRERERSREAEGRRETRKQRRAREAEEAAAAKTPPPLSTTPAAAPTALATAAPVASAASSGVSSTGYSQAATRGPHKTRAATRASRPRRVGDRSRAIAPSALASPLRGLPRAAAGASRRPVTKTAARTLARRPARPPSSPLVTTVTQIIGVVPAWLWSALGGLALLSIGLAALSRVSAARAARLSRQRQELLEDVGLLQAALLPQLPDRVGPVATSVAYRPASGPGAGGDFYDLFALEDGTLAVIVGDVSGHGREALPHTTLLRFTLRAYLEAGLSPRQALRTAAPGLERQLGDSFATVVLAIYDPRRRLLTYACAGHPHPVFSGLDPEAAILACSAPPIGAGQRTGTRQTTVSVPGAATVCFYTDGVTEARVGADLYGTTRLAAALAGLGCERTASALLDRVASETDRRPDDMAACLLGVSGEALPPQILEEELELDGRDADRARTRRFLLTAGIPEHQLESVLRSARATAADHTSALLKLRLGDGPPEVIVTHDNVAPLQARAIARTQEVAL